LETVYVPSGQTIIYWRITLVFIAKSLEWARKDLDEMKIPMLAALGAGTLLMLGLSLGLGKVLGKKMGLKRPLITIFSL